jgi:hypothetical protein
MIKTSYYTALRNVHQAKRENHGAQYGYGSNNWGIFPGSFLDGNAYTAYDAIKEFNADAGIN